MRFQAHALTKDLKHILGDVEPHDTHFDDHRPLLPRRKQTATTRRGRDQYTGRKQGVAKSPQCVIPPQESDGVGYTEGESATGNCLLNLAQLSNYRVHIR
jgi:hypothetical protein